MKNIELINASAGSGKTYTLTARVVELLKNGMAPESLMATTFTNRAAGELRERIRVELLKNNQQDEANRINDGFIGTVNSICARLLKEYALDAGMSPAVEIMPEEDSSTIFRISIDHFLDKYADQIEPLARRMEIDGSGQGMQGKADWRDDVKRIVDLARNNQISVTDLKLCSDHSCQTIQELFPEPAQSDLDQELYEAIKYAVSSLYQMETMTKTTQSAFEELKNCKNRFEHNRLTWSDWARLSKLKSAKDGQDVIFPVNAIADNVLNHSKFQTDVKQLIESVFACAIDALQGFETYKQKQGLMDFTDQETHVLNMAQHNIPFRLSVSNRIKTLMVDEFQDTSPIQLALFLALNELVEKSVWVGDPKQAIYGFRGTDPQLMNEVVALIGESQVLDSSWRSKENLLDFTNALFCEVFHKMGKAKVCLKVPPARALKAKGGNLEVWHLNAKNISEDADSIANGVRDLLERFPEIKPGDIAVLSRTNNNCMQIAASLEKLGVRVSVGQGMLLDTKVSGLALAALRYMNNQNDTVALTEIVQGILKPGENSDWLSELMTNPLETIEGWQTDPIIARLNEGRNSIKFWTPVEALEQAISRIDLINLVKSWPNPDLAVSNLDVLRKICHEYIDQCSSHRSAASVDGFITYLKDSEAKQAQGIGQHTVNVLTYHGCKGLEWPWVVLTGLDTEPKTRIFGVNIEAALQFDPADPLADRKIRYWPWPFGAQKSYPPLDYEIDRLPIKSSAQETAEQEAQRLLYVGMTRAKDGLVLAMRKATTSKGESLKTAGLDALKNSIGEKVISWNTENESEQIQVGDAKIPIITFQYGPDSDGLATVSSAEEEYLPIIKSSPKDYPEARISPSKLTQTVDTDGESWGIMSQFKTRINIKGKPAMDILGSAIHTYLGIDYAELEEVEQMTVARKIIKNWGMDTIVDPEEVVLAGQHLVEFLEKNYPGHKTYKEWPMSMRNQDGQVMQGWIDLLLETEAGYVIIDHKDYPGQDAIERAKKYTPQLKAYKEAVETATGRPVIDIIIHLPVSGLFLKLF